MRIAVLGSGGREAAIVWKLSQTLPPENIFALPGNPGIPGSQTVIVEDFDELRDFLSENRIDTVFVGPEKLLSMGVVDAFNKGGIRVLGPDQKAAKLETSKARAKEFMGRHKVATGAYENFFNPLAARQGLKKWPDGCVVKFDGLAAGKGVHVCPDLSSARKAIDQIELQHGKSAKIVLEEILEGWELSVIGFTDGRTFRSLPPCQDFKQLLDGDAGPNTGGMGAFCPVPEASPELMAAIGARIIEPTLQGIRAEGLNYHGPLYFGIMVTREGPKLLEYNVRLGDPETQVLMPALKTDLVQIIESCLRSDLTNLEIEINPGVFLGVVLASGGYPGSSSPEVPIEGLGSFGPGTRVFHSGTRRDGDSWKAVGGRVLTVVAGGGDVSMARENVYRECERISFKGMQFRKDIGTRKNVSWIGGQA